MENPSAIKNLLDQKYLHYNSPLFIPSDPISIPHRYTSKHDRESAAFLAATIAWGQRKTIVTNAGKLMEGMDNAPFDFIVNFRESDLRPFEGFVHRTFNFSDLTVFLFALKNIYQEYGGMETIFEQGLKKGDMGAAINYFREVFFSIPHLSRTRKHVSNPLAGASAKRINMFLRWMVRNDDKGVDFGIWKNIKTSDLVCPLDIHSGNVARKLGLLSRKQNDWKAALELTSALRQFDPADPVKYDFALFGMGVFEKY